MQEHKSMIYQIEQAQANALTESCGKVNTSDDLGGQAIALVKSSGQTTTLVGSCGQVSALVGNMWKSQYNKLLRWTSNCFG